VATHTYMCTYILHTYMYVYVYQYSTLNVPLFAIVNQNHVVQQPHGIKKF